MRRIWLVQLVVFPALSVAVSASPAAASVTVGQVAPNPSLVSCGGGSTDFIQSSVTSGDAYFAPGAGTITSWSHNARSGMGQTLTMKIFRKIGEPRTYEVVGHDGPREIASGALNTFPASIQVKQGDVLGLDVTSSADTSCDFAAPGSEALTRLGSLGDGQSGTFAIFPGGIRVNVSATFAYSNSFSLGAVGRNKRKGTATLTVVVPNPGDLTASGKGVEGASADSHAVTSKSVGVGPAQLLIKAKGKKTKTLNETGKVKLNVTVTYTPTGGDPSTQSVKVKLKKKL